MPTPPDGVDVITILRHATRGGTAAAWAAANPVLAPREEGIETDTMRRKVGDGATTWLALPYFRESDLGRWYEQPCPTPTIGYVTVTHNKGRDPVAWTFLETATGVFYDINCNVLVSGVSARVNLDISLVGKILLTF